jgi:hypothetical protein
MRIRQPFFILILGILLFSSAGAAVADPDLLDNQPTTLLYPPFWHTPMGIHRGTPDMLALFVGNRTHFDGPQGLACNRLLSDLSEKTDEPEFRLTVIGANTGQAHLIYNPDLAGLDVIGDQQNLNGLLKKPLGLAMTPAGVVYIADAGQPAVHALRSVRGKFNTDSVLPAPPEGWKTPWGVGLDSTGQIYITDAGRDQIFIYSAEGKWQKTLGPELSPGVRLSHPEAIAVVDPGERWSYYHDAYIYVCDRQGQRLVRMDLNGIVHSAVTPRDLACGNTLTTFGWIALDYYENCWITDRDNGQLIKLNRHLQFLDTYGRPGAGDGCFSHPSGLAIFRHFGQVFVAEDHGAHYFWVGADVRDSRAEWEKIPGLFRINFFLTEPAWVTIAYPDAQGRTSYLCQKQWLDSGPQKVFGSLGVKTPATGTPIELTAEATYSSASYFAKRIKITLPPKP